MQGLTRSQSIACVLCWSGYPTRHGIRRIIGRGVIWLPGEWMVCLIKLLDTGDGAEFILCTLS